MGTIPCFAGAFRLCKRRQIDWEKWRESLLSLDRMIIIRFKMKTIKYKGTEVYRTACGKFGENPELSCNRVGSLSIVSLSQRSGEARN